MVLFVRRFPQTTSFACKQSKTILEIQKKRTWGEKFSKFIAGFWNSGLHTANIYVPLHKCMEICMCVYLYKYNNKS